MYAKRGFDVMLNVTLLKNINWVNCACMQEGGSNLLIAECFPMCLKLKNNEWVIKLDEFDINFYYCMYDVILLTPLYPQICLTARKLWIFVNCNMLKCNG